MTDDWNFKYKNSENVISALKSFGHKIENLENNYACVQQMYNVMLL